MCPRKRTRTLLRTQSCIFKAELLQPKSPFQYIKTPNQKNVHTHLNNMHRPSVDTKYNKSYKRLCVVDEEGGEDEDVDVAVSKNGGMSAAGAKTTTKPVSNVHDPVHRLAMARHEFGEHGGVNMSIEASATFTVMEPETLGKLFTGELGPSMDFYIYSRHFNPTILNLSRQLAALEGTEAAYCTSSGMSAIACVLLQLCGHGDHIVASNRLYGGTYALLGHFLPRACGITTTFVDTDRGTPDEVAERVRVAIASAPTKILYLESVSNPTLCRGHTTPLGYCAWSPRWSSCHRRGRQHFCTHGLVAHPPRCRCRGPQRHQVHERVRRHTRRGRVRPRFAH